MGLKTGEGLGQLPGPLSLLFYALYYVQNRATKDSEACHVDLCQ